MKAQPVKITRNCVIWALVLLSGICAGAEVTLESLLTEMIDYASVARWPQPEFTCQASQQLRPRHRRAGQARLVRQQRPEPVHPHRDKSGPHREGDAGRRRARLHRALLADHRPEQEGHAALLSRRRGGAGAGFPAYDLLSGDLKIGPPLVQPHPGYRPDGNGGNNFYLPIPYAKHCKITWEEAGQSSRYYQINYRTYAPGTAVQTFTRAALEAGPASAVERVNKALLAPPDEPQGQTIAAENEIATGGEHSLELPPGPAAVRRLELRVPASQLASPERALRSLILQMNCDGEPTVWCPVSDFFGSGVGLNPFRVGIARC